MLCPNIWTFPSFQRIYYQSLYCNFVLYSELESLQQQTHYPVQSQEPVHQCTTYSYFPQHNGQYGVSRKLLQLCVSFVQSSLLSIASFLDTQLLSVQRHTRRAAQRRSTTFACLKHYCQYAWPGGVLPSATALCSCTACSCLTLNSKLPLRRTLELVVT